MWTDKNDAKTLWVDPNFFENGERKLRFQTNTDTCGHGLSRAATGKEIRPTACVMHVQCNVLPVKTYCFNFLTLLRLPNELPFYGLLYHFSINKV